MSDEANNPLDPADPPETQPPTDGGTISEPDADTTELTRSADVPETQPPQS